MAGFVALTFLLDRCIPRMIRITDITLIAAMRNPLSSTDDKNGGSKIEGGVVCCSSGAWKED